MPTGPTPSTPPPPPPRRTPPTPKPDPLKSSIDAIRANASQLNALTDHAGHVVQKVEEFLNEQCSVGVPAYVQFRGDGEDPEGTYLAYRRVGPRYRIAIVEVDDRGDDTEHKAWSDSPRDLKLESFSKLPTLLAQVADRVKTMIDNTKESIKQVEESLRALTAG
ncbi:MAG TPA: hypothetical protein VD866_12360 [Urbifossiella sp.]|nr:hypothetical protein [Urbifossiella sp.]